MVAVDHVCGDMLNDCLHDSCCVSAMEVLERGQEEILESIQNLTTAVERVQNQVRIFVTPVVLC